MDDPGRPGWQAGNMFPDLALNGVVHPRPLSDDPEVPAVGEGHLAHVADMVTLGQVTPRSLTGRGMHWDLWG